MKSFMTVFSLILLSACSSTHRDTAFAPRSERVQTYGRQAQHSERVPMNGQQTSQSEQEQMNDLSIYAISLYDTAYHYGGTSLLSGFDCSGFVQYVFKNSLGAELPRTSFEMSRIGRSLTKAQLQPGDLVFFNTTHRHYSHVGIFIGKQRFVHAPRTGKRIELSDMNLPYWRTHYEGARRISSSQATMNTYQLSLNN